MGAQPTAWEVLPLGLRSYRFTHTHPGSLMCQEGLLLGHAKASGGQGQQPTPRPSFRE